MRTASEASQPARRRGEFSVRVSVSAPLSRYRGGQFVERTATLLRLRFGDVDDRFGKRVWGLLRQIMPDAARDGSMRVFAGEFFGIGGGFGMRRAIGVALEGNGRHGDDRRFGKPLFQIVVFWLTLREPKSPAIIVNHDGDVIRVIERRRTAVESGVIEARFGEASCHMSFEKSRRYLS